MNALSSASVLTHGGHCREREALQLTTTARPRRTDARTAPILHGGDEGVCDGEYAGVCAIYYAHHIEERHTRRIRMARTATAGRLIGVAAAAARPGGCEDVLPGAAHDIICNAILYAIRSICVYKRHLREHTTPILSLTVHGYALA